jgi:Family of unknown function (DUF6445)
MSTPLPAIGFNPRPRIEVLRLDAQASCLVVDDALLDPEALRRYATARRADFVQAPFNAYPGIELPMPLEFSARLQDFFDRHIRNSLGGRRTVKMNSRLAMVTTPPDALEPRQRICHRDSAWIDPAQTIAASVLYLFEDATLGGTSFYRPRLSEEATRQLVHDSSVMDRASFNARHPSITQDYMGESNDYFERIGQVPTRWNRMIFYDGRLFHSGEVGNTRALTGDPRTGRLTLNGFFTCSRPAG